MSNGLKDALISANAHDHRGDQVTSNYDEINWNRTVAETSIEGQVLAYDKNGKCVVYNGPLPVDKSPEERSPLLEGVKYDADKPGMSLLPSKPLQEIAKVLDYGARKYAPHNWRKGINYSRVYSAALRHLTQWNEGQDTDSETNINHLAHAACNLLFLLDYQLSNKTGFDDRYKG